MTKKIEVHYFAFLMQETGKECEDIMTSAETLEELFEELKKKHTFSLNQKQVRAAINERIANDWKLSISSGDKIIFIPPLAGG